MVRDAVRPVQCSLKPKRVPKKSNAFVAPRSRKLEYSLKFGGSADEDMSDSDTSSESSWGEYTIDRKSVV